MKRFYISSLWLLIITITVAQENNFTWAQKVKAKTFINLHKLNDSLYRSEQPDSLDIVMLKQLGVKTILNLRKYHNDVDFLRAQDFTFFEVEMSALCFKDKQVVEALKIIKAAPKPFLFHCKHGSDRTGLIAAMYRIVFEGWTKDLA